VVTQETGWSKYIPTGQGLFAYETMDEAIVAIQSIYNNYKKHSIAAKEIAYEYFDSKRF